MNILLSEEEVRVPHFIVGAFAGTPDGAMLTADGQNTIMQQDHIIYIHTHACEEEVRAPQNIQAMYV